MGVIDLTTARSARADTPGRTDFVVSADGVSLRRRGRLVLDDVSVAVRRGEVVAVVGPNGAGKSTLLGVLAGDLRPDAGEVRIFDRPVVDRPLAELARERSVLPQRHQVSFSFTVAEVVRMGRSPWRRTSSPQEDERLVAEAMALTGVAALADRPVSALSGGEQARVALARVLAQHTPVLFLDEPTAALDLRHQDEVLHVARDRAAGGATVVVVVHDLSLAAAHADSLILMDAGVVRAAGTPADVLDAELLSRVYGTRLEVLVHPDHATPLVVPDRSSAWRSHP